jgi:squalene-hopene/tetraprenyl-beta-curcumene cyclase
MNAAAWRVGALATFLVAGFVLVSRRAETKTVSLENPKATASHLHKPEGKSTNAWDHAAAAAYLDQRAKWWMEWPKAARDHETFCISCHTAVPYALSRPALRQGLAEQAPSASERKLLDNVTKRVRLWKEVAPFYSDADRGAYKTVESRGTESVLNALVLASNDAQLGHLSNDTRNALDYMWAEQQTSGDNAGAWSWLRFRNEPWEADDSDFYGAVLAAVATGTAPENYRAKPVIQHNINLLREYVDRHYQAQTTINRISLLWAAAKLPGLLKPDQQSTLIREVRGQQQPDGGWSLSSLVGDWKRADGTPQETKSDGYATGFACFALQQAGISKDDTQLNRGLSWLVNNQDKTGGFWLSYSLNKNEAHHLSPDTARFMNDAATAYAVLALTQPDRQ